MALDALISLTNNLKQFNYGEELTNVIADNTTAYEDLQAEQMSQGKDVEGNPIVLDGNPEYQPATIDHKKRFGSGLGAITDRITRYQTGALYRELFAKVTQGEVIISSGVDYWDTLLERTGPKGTGLDYDMRLRFAEEKVMPEFKKVFKEKTGLEIS